MTKLVLIFVAAVVAVAVAFPAADLQETHLVDVPVRIVRAAEPSPQYYHNHGGFGYPYGGFNNGYGGHHGGHGGYYGHGHGGGYHHGGHHGGHHGYYHG